jgi:uncharacterized membrane protein
MTPLEQEQEKFIVQSRRRILIKAVMYRIFTFLLTLSVTYLFLKDKKETLKYTMIMEIITFGFYYSYELMWNYIPINT